MTRYVQAQHVRAGDVLVHEMSGAHVEVVSAGPHARLQGWTVIRYRLDGLSVEASDAMPDTDELEVVE